MVVREGEVHHRPDLDLAVDGDRLLLDGVQAEHGGLREVDDGRAHERAEDAAVADGEGAAGHVLDGELVVARLEESVSTVVDKLELQHLTFLPSSAMAFSMPTISRASALRTTGVTNPFSVETATLMST